MVEEQLTVPYFPRPEDKSEGEGEGTGEGEGVGEGEREGIRLMHAGLPTFLHLVKAPFDEDKWKQSLREEGKGTDEFSYHNALRYICVIVMCVCN